MSTIAERVAAGAAFLDEHDPDWWRADVERAIDLDKLSLSDPSRCVLGQRCPTESLNRFLSERFTLSPDEVWYPGDWSFWALAYELSATPPGTEGDESTEGVVTWSGELGFNSPDSDLNEFADLNAEWKHVITERRSAR